MRAVVQRVKRAHVDIKGEEVGAIGRGLLVLLGVAQGDTEQDAIYMAEKVAHLRIFEDAEGKMNLSIIEIAGEVLVVSQFTLLGDCRKGRRPSFAAAAAPNDAEKLYRYFVDRLRSYDLPVKTGRFREMMDVHLINEGPVTMLLDSEKLF